jgi:hypothetical protein
VNLKSHGLKHFFLELYKIWILVELALMIQKKKLRLFHNFF